jgi:hypothetical protein
LHPSAFLLCFARKRIKPLHTLLLSAMASFNFRSVQSLELLSTDNPVLTLQNTSFVLTATRGTEQIQISAPIDLLKVVNQSVTVSTQSFKVKTRKITKPMPGGDKRVGELNGQAKLTNAAVREIRSIAADKGLRDKYPNKTAFYREIAKAYGVNFYTVMNVIRRISWKHIED